MVENCNFVYEITINCLQLNSSLFFFSHVDFLLLSLERSLFFLFLKALFFFIRNSKIRHDMFGLGLGAVEC